MFASILYICISVILCCVLWQLLLSLFYILSLDIKLTQYKLFHYIVICSYTLFTYYITMYCNKVDIYGSVNNGLSDSIYIIICVLVCFIILHVLSVLDFYIKKVPNILLALLFVCSNILYLLTNVVYNGYPFMILGIVYGIYFIIHLIGNRQYMGEGDVWIIACLSILLESFFTHEIKFIFELLCFASIMGICYYYVLLWRCKRLNGLTKDSNETLLQAKQIPFIPFLSTSFLCVSVWHAT